jgi:hypothetical protein
MKHLLAPTAIVATVAVLFSAITPAHACSCAQLSVEETVANADVVAIGMVTDLLVLGPNVDAARGDVDALVSVSTYLKGSGPPSIAVDDPVGDGDCGFIDETDVGERLLFFLTTSEGVYKTNLCAGNALLTGEFVDEPTVNAYLAEVEAVTGPGQPPDTDEPTPPAEDDDLPREAFWALALALPIAFLVGATLSPWRRK